MDICKKSSQEVEDSQTENRFETIVLSGGGTKGILQLGVLHYYHEKKIYDQDYVHTYAACSIGGAISLLLVCGYTPMEIFRQIYCMESIFNTGDCNAIWDVIKYMGLMSITKFTDKIENLVMNKLGKIPTLKELKDITGKTLIVTACNVTKMCVEYYTPDTKPNLGCINAIKITCNLPVIFQRIHYEDSYCIDGGLLDNFPIQKVDVPKGERKILGIVVEGNDVTLPDDTFLGYFYRLMLLPVKMITSMRCEGLEDNVTLIKVRWDGAPLLQFAMESETKMNMFLKGVEEAKAKYLSGAVEKKESVDNDWDIEWEGLEWEDGCKIRKQD